MRIALIAPPFIPVPPPTYGGTELFVSQLATELQRCGHDVVIYANGESSVACQVRYLYEKADWPLRDMSTAMLKNLNHVAWAVADCKRGFDIVHLNDGLAVCLSPLIAAPTVLTIHHPYEPSLSALYAEHTEIQYVAISRAQASREQLHRVAVIHHGVDLSCYEYRETKDGYLSFLGRIAPCKGAHLAIEVAERTGLPLKIAGEIQPLFHDYWNTMVRPHVDGHLVEYVGELDLPGKSEFLSRSTALLFPIQWEEPFGLVMIEAMACGTPVLALPGGSVEEVVENGVNGWICRNVDELAARALDIGISARSCRDGVARRFTHERMASDYEMLYQRLLGEPPQPAAAAPHGDGSHHPR
jgi:glycosyltransferase involved in cell wall biosynthesis